VFSIGLLFVWASVKLPNGIAPNSRKGIRSNGGRSAKNQSELPQKAKVKCHKKPKLFGGIRENS
jgi:hypothetical protein